MIEVKNAVKKFDGGRYFLNNNGNIIDNTLTA